MARHPDRAYMHETVPIIWVVLQELALGVPKVLAETTMEVWLKERLERARGRRPIETDREEEQREPVSGFQAALEAVGFVCLEEPVLARRGPIFVHIRDYGVTFLPEPNLPKKALLEATRLLLEDERRAKAAASDRPLRWDLRKERWRPLPEDWASEDGEKRLVAEWRQLIAASRPS
ncbi:MAG: hypothetical protein JO342_14700 [Solirubrobacterales bacterium]|nr:hypothetical protein [Solirubrobacterales bacterium]MBV9167386.1 hypothetical protein [Solirubrobacterales bacterium]